MTPNGSYERSGDGAEVTMAKMLVDMPILCRLGTQMHRLGQAKVGTENSITLDLTSRAAR